MNFLKNFIGEISRQRLRTFLTLFGIIWGTATLIVLLAFGMGFRDQMALNMRGMGEEIVIVFGSQTTRTWQGFGTGRRIRLRESDLEVLKQQIAQIREISPEYSTWQAVLSNGERRNTPQLTGVPVPYGEMRNIFALQGGRWFNERDIEERRRVIFLGDGLNELLFGSEESVGEVVMVNQTPFRVIGVMQSKSQNSSYGQRDRDRAFIPYSTYSTLFGTDILNNFIYTLAHPDDSPHVQDRLYEILAGRHHFDPADRDALMVWDTSQFWGFMSAFFTGFNTFLGIIGIVTLAVGGIGVANIMFVVVQEKKKEIGIRRAAGAKRRNILGYFFGETFLLIGIGAVVGYLAGWAVVQALQFIPIREYVGTPQFTPMVGLVCFIVLALIGLAAGAMPAVRASRVDIVECLK